jgi:ribosomal protein S18 acetylase RimI-like enzyme
MKFDNSASASSPFKVSIREAVETDVAAIMNIVRLVLPIMNEIGNYQWDHEYPLEANFMNDISNHELWVAVKPKTSVKEGDTLDEEDEEEVVGMIALLFEQPEEYALLDWDISLKAMVPHRLAVSPHCKGMGISKLLMKFAEEHALAHGLDRIRIDTCTINPVTMSLFPSLGYVKQGETKLKGAPQYLDFACFEKVLI